MSFPVSCNRITDQALQKLSREIGQTLVNLQHLSLDFKKCSKITDQGLKELALQVGYRLANLKHLSLHFEECGITSQGLKSLPSNFPL